MCNDPSINIVGVQQLDTPQNKNRSTIKGFTLLELLITVAVAALLIGLTASTFSQVSNTQIRVQSNQVASAMRHSFGYAVSYGKYLRMVFDIDSNSFWVESSDEAIFLNKEKRQEGDDPNELTEEEQERNEKAKEEGHPPPVKRATFSKESVISEVKFEKGVKIDGVFTSNQEDIFKNGKAYIHFFPNGFAEPAIVYMTNKDAEGVGATYSLILQPLTGKVKREFGLIEPDQYFGQPTKDEAEDGR